MSKLVLGTVQFGVKYGINNITGQVPISEVKEILKIADKAGIRILDTSSGYGDSECVLGKAMQECGIQFQLVSKYPTSEEGVNNTFNASLSKLGVTTLYGYMVHHFDFYQERPEIYDTMQELKESGRIQKIGFSLYSVAQLQTLFDNKVKFDILQFPYNLLDRQFEPYLPQLKMLGVEIHTRSVFLQGLFFKKTEELPRILMPIKIELDLLHNYVNENHISMEQLALSYVIANKDVDGVLVGVDNHYQLENNIQASRYKPSKKDIDFIHSIDVREKRLLNPVNWN